MDFLYVHFPTSGVDTWVFFPPLIAFCVSFLTSMGGVSGALLLLPFQVSVLGYTSPSVSATNHVFNVIAIPSGVYRYLREGRMVWPLTWPVIFGTLPGVFIGAWMRIACLPDLKNFKLFVGAVLFLIGFRLALETFAGRGEKAIAQKGKKTGRILVTGIRQSLKRVEYNFGERAYSFGPPGVFFVSFLVGLVGGIYGIGGGAMVAPIFVTIFKMPIYTVAGAALMGSFVTSLAGAVFFQILGWSLSSPLAVAPDWMLGALFGIGGAFGMYGGARMQKYVPGRAIRAILTGCLLFVAIKYMADFLR
jgi:hypothetical protein